MIKNLTKKQKAEIPKYVKKYQQIGLNTDPCNRELAEKYIKASYVYLGHKEPKFIWCDSPYAGARLAAQRAEGRKRVSRAEIRAQMDKASWGSFEAVEVASYVYLKDCLKVKDDDGLIGIVDGIIKNCGVYWTFENLVVVSERPTAIHLKGGKLHNANMQAVEYRDGTGVYVLNGKYFSSRKKLQAAFKQGESK